MLGAVGEPVLKCGGTLRVFAAAGEEADAVLGHGVLIGGLIAEVNAPADMVGVIGGGAVEEAVIEEDGAAGRHGEGDDFAAVDFVLGEGEEARAGIRLLVMGNDPFAVGAGNEVETAVFEGGVDERDPAGDDGIGVGIGPVGFVLMPRNSTGGDLRDLGADVVDGIGEDFGADEGFDDIENLRITHEDEVAGQAVAPATAVFEKFLVGQAGAEFREAIMKGPVGEGILDFAIADEFCGDHVDLLGHGLTCGGEIGVGEEIFEEEVALGVVACDLFGGEAAGGLAQREFGGHVVGSGLGATGGVWHASVC